MSEKDIISVIYFTFYEAIRIFKPNYIALLNFVQLKIMYISSLTRQRLLIWAYQL